MLDCFFFKSEKLSEEDLESFPTSSLLSFLSFRRDTQRAPLLLVLLLFF